MSPWYLTSNPSATPAEIAALSGYVREFSDPETPPWFKRTVLITVMKNSNRLGKVKEVLENIARSGVNLAKSAVLVIDDEADQAGLNAAPGEEEPSATYAAIASLRSAIPRHSYVMYTATPQAPLLVNIADTLSPEFVSVLTPGRGYTGGQYFFKDHRSTFVQEMSSDEIEEALDPSPTEPPSSLESALATYLLVRSIRGRRSHTSMLVHPSHGRDLHSVYASFVTGLLRSWKSLLKLPGADRDELVEAYFTPAYLNLSEKSSNPLPPLDDLLVNLPFWITSTQVRTVNSGTPADSDIRWGTAPSWILIGGNKLDRGFTVEGLAVTYMPRGLGVGNVDTLQQRARFFGYKAAYGSLCRVWLSATMAAAFEHYVDHEENLRTDLQAVDREGRSLQEWTRTMLLNPEYKPTRRAVIDLPYLHGGVRGEQWSNVASVAHLGRDGLLNLAAVETFQTHHGRRRETDPRDARKGARRNTVFTVPLETLLTELLADWYGRSTDRAGLQQLILVLQARVDQDPSLLADVYLMDDLEVRERATRADLQTVNNLQQGRSPQGRYIGDMAFYTEDRTSIQVHHVVSRSDAEGPSWEAAGLSIRVPSGLAGGALLQVDAE